MPITKPFAAVYVSKPEYIQELCAELNHETEVMGNLVFSPIVDPGVCFAMDIWFEPQLVEFESISAAVRVLREASKFWYLNPIENVRRSLLITEQLRKLPTFSHQFPVPTDLPVIGCFSLLDKNTLVYSVCRLKKWPLGQVEFIEDKINPPNRAYLKLWDALTVLGKLPQVGDTAVDLGASPGGWTYVMQSLGAKVIAVDKAPLDPRIESLAQVKFLQQSAFALNPEEWEGTIDWLLCDVACYPDRLYKLVMQWINAKKAKQMIFTIKLQGETNLAIINQFRAIPHSRVLHLFYNKHEATFLYPGPGEEV